MATAKKAKSEGRKLNVNVTKAAKSSKNRVLTALLAIFLGGIGIHKFYLGNITWGLIYLIFAWTWIPMIVGVIEGIIYLTMSDKEFTTKYS